MHLPAAWVADFKYSYSKHEITRRYTNSAKLRRFWTWQQLGKLGEIEITWLFAMWDTFEESTRGHVKFWFLGESSTVKRQNENYQVVQDLVWLTCSSCDFCVTSLKKKIQSVYQHCHTELKLHSYAYMSIQTGSKNACYSPAEPPNNKRWSWPSYPRDSGWKRLSWITTGKFEKQRNCFVAISCVCHAYYAEVFTHAQWLRFSYSSQGTQSSFNCAARAHVFWRHM